MFDSFKKMFSSGEAGEKGELEKKLQLHPNDAQTRQRLALILLRDRQVKEGLVHLAKVAESYESTGFDSKAVAVYRQFLKYESDNPDVNRKLVAILSRQGLAGDARIEFEKVAPKIRLKVGDEGFVDYCRSLAKVLPGSATPELLACDVLLSQKKLVEVFSSLVSAAEPALAAPGERVLFADVLSRFAAACGSRTDFAERTGFLWLRLGEVEKALPHLEKALTSLRASNDPAAAGAERVIQAVREGKEVTGTGVCSFSDALVTLDTFFPTGEGNDIVTGGDDHPPQAHSDPAHAAAHAEEHSASAHEPESSTPGSHHPPTASSDAPPAPLSPAEMVSALGEEDQGMVRSAFGRLHARVEEEIGESDLEARYNLGIAYKEMGLIDEALREFTIARKRSDLAFSCAVHLAEIYAGKGEFDTSIAELDSLIGACSHGTMELFDLRYQKAEVFEAAGRNAEAGEIFRSLLAENPNYRDIRTRAERYKG